MKRLTPLLLALFLLLLGRLAARAQSVGIGTATPDASAALDVAGTARGLLVPRLTVAQRTGITAPATGLLVFQTDGTASGGPQTGFWYYAGTPAAWTFLDPTGADNLGNHAATQNLALAGNALTGTGASIGAALGLGVRADGGLNLGQNTTGNNVYLGFQAGQVNTTGSNNQFVGYQSGRANTSGSRNQFSGYQSGFSNTSGGSNLFSGPQSGYANTTGIFNLFNGYQSGYTNTTGSGNLFSGYRSGYANTTGNNNVFLGYVSGFANTTGDENVFIGSFSGSRNTTGRRNVFSGDESGLFNTTGSENVFNGYQSGRANTEGSNNIFVGTQTGAVNTTGDRNVFVGPFSAYHNTTGFANQFSGYQSGFSNTTGNSNLFSGFSSGYYNTTGSSNTALGSNAGPALGSGALTNATALGNNAAVSQSNSLVLGGTGANAVNVGIGTAAPAARLHLYGPGVTVLRLQSSNGFSPAGVDLWSDPQGSATEWRPAFLRSTDAGGFTGGLAFFTNGSGGANRTGVVEGMRLVNGRLGIGTATPGFTLDVNGSIRCVGAVNTTSDQRLKQGIRPLAGALAGVLALRGVRYTFRQAEFPGLQLPAGEQLGLLAQELEAVYPELVHTGPDGFKAVNYAQLAPVLIEALKEQQAQLEQLQARADADHAALLSLQAQVARLAGPAAPAGAQAQR